MVISRRQRSPPPPPSFPSPPPAAAHQHDNAWLNQHRESTLWHVSPPQLKPAVPVASVSVTDRSKLFEDVAPPARLSNPLNAFLNPSTLTDHDPDANPDFDSDTDPDLEPKSELPLKTKIGNRDIKPLVHSPNPTPLPGLPVPAHNAEINSMAEIDQPHDTSSRRYSVRHSRQSSVRHSVRVKSSAAPPPPLFDLPPPPPPDAAAPTLPHPDQLDILPDSSSFLDFNDDHRLAHSGPAVDPIHPHASTSAVNRGSFDDPDDEENGGTGEDDAADSFDTFASLQPNQAQPIPDQPQPHSMPHHAAALRLSCSDSTEKPEFPSLSFHSTDNSGKPGVSNDGDEDGGLDVSACLSSSPDANRAMRDLQRASITAANELANSIRLMSQQADDTVSPLPGNTGPAHPLRHPADRLQGQLFLRSRIFRRWNVRYGTIVNQSYFGQVLLLFRSDAAKQRQQQAPPPPQAAALKLKSSKMIALGRAEVAVQDEPRKHSSGQLYIFSLTTSERTYTFACNDSKTRSLWVSTLSSASAAPLNSLPG